MRRGRPKSKEIVERVIKEAEFMIKNNTLTLREAAKVLFVSKSTLHMDLSKRLPLIDKGLYKKVHAILNRHNKERYHNGGVAAAKKRCTRKKNGGKY